VSICLGLPIRDVSFKMVYGLWVWWCGLVWLAGTSFNLDDGFGGEHGVMFKNML
jgi:hypothetical protein